MSVSLVFLLAAVGLSMVGIFILWAAQRRPRRSRSSIDDFRDGLDALAPPAGSDPAAPSMGPIDPEPGED